MKTKHTPATPFETWEHRSFRMEQDRAKLIEALRVCADWMCEAYEGSDQRERGDEARALLRSLGEDA